VSVMLISVRAPHPRHERKVPRIIESNSLRLDEFISAYL
jgi:hypothetical protein